MNLTEVSVKYPALEPVVKQIKECDNVGSLYPPQEDAINAGFLDGKNLVLSIPTASGKTLIAELAMMNMVLQGKKAVYLSPLKALASEKYADMKKKYGNLVKIGISTGDYDSSGSELSGYDIIILTVEKLDSIMRHTPEWINEIGVAVIDEIHLLDSTHRGPTLEIVITKMKDLSIQFIALSATIENSDEVAEWLNAELVTSEFRPVELSRGVYFGNEISFDAKDDLKIKNESPEPTSQLASDILQRGGQSLIFVSSRPSAEREAEKVGTDIYKQLSTKEKKELTKVSERILRVLESPTKQCKRLSNCILNGVAFHHAGLHQKQRELIEENFKNTLIKSICATPTLAWGVNLPAKRVVIRDYKRYGTFGMEPIPILEIHQMFGRAGRPMYDTDGEAVLIAKSHPEFEQLWEHYIEGRPEPISSKLGMEPVLRMHSLGAIAQLPQKKENLYEFFERSFYAYQYSNLEGIYDIIDRVLDQLFKWNFLDYSDKEILRCTTLGQRVAQLYIDPLTAHDFIELLQENTDDMVVLTILSDTAEMRPLAALKSAEEGRVYEDFLKYDLKDEQIRAFKNALIFSDWMSEISDDKIYDKYGVPPGTLRSKLNIADWLLYACGEISKIIGREKIIAKTGILRKRLRYGVKPELLPLVRLRNIGRIRARHLYKLGFKSVEDLKKASPEKLAKILGKGVSKKVLEQIS